MKLGIHFVWDIGYKGLWDLINGYASILECRDALGLWIRDNLHIVRMAFWDLSGNAVESDVKIETVEGQNM